MLKDVEMVSTWLQHVEKSFCPSSVFLPKYSKYSKKKQVLNIIPIISYLLSEISGFFRPWVSGVSGVSGVVLASRSQLNCKHRGCQQRQLWQLWQPRPRRHRLTSHPSWKCHIYIYSVFVCVFACVYVYKYVQVWSCCLYLYSVFFHAKALKSMAWSWFEISNFIGIIIWHMSLLKSTITLSNCPIWGFP